MPSSYRVAAGLFSLITIAAAVITAGYWPGDPALVRAGAGGVVVYAAIAALLWGRTAWAKPVAVGAAGWAMGVWAQSLGALWLFAPGSVEAQISMRTGLGGLVLSGLALGASLLIPRHQSARHFWSTGLAGAALVPAIVFALMPGQALGVSLAMGVGAVALLLGTAATGVGRTWGLLANLFGAAVIAIGVGMAPALAMVNTVNPWLPNGTALLPIVVGLSAAIPAALSSVLFLGPVVRFVRRG